MRAMLATACLVAAAAAGALTAGTAEAASGGSNTFSGTCAFRGDASFSPPATNTLQRLDVRYDATGTCSGTLNGRRVSDVPVTLRQAVREVNGSCPRADTTRPGRGVITFADGTRIAYRFEFHFPSPMGTFTFRGERSGSARGVGNLLTPRTPPDVAERCAGAGVSKTPLDVWLVTERPLVSEGRGDPSRQDGRPPSQEDRHITGTSGDDVLVGTPSDDFITCGAGHDRVDSGAGDDVIHCGSGDDAVAAGAGNDRVHGGSGDDHLRGDSGDDVLFGESGNDKLDGGPGGDRLNGGAGRDSMSRPETDGGKTDRASSFRGECQFSGTVVFEPPLTNQPQAVSQRVRAPGTCSGTFVDRRGRPHQLADAPTTFSESSRGDGASCMSGSAIGRGSLAFQLGKIRFAFRETRIGGVVYGEALGTESGSARGVGTVSRSENPAAIAQRCAGPGLKKVKVDIELATTPVISG